VKGEARVVDSALLSETTRRRDLCDFLKHARSRISPSEAGIFAVGRRRVAGLRREEVAALCGVSVAWYTWFETGRSNVHASPRLIAAVARALRLGVEETTYLFSLAIAEMPRLKAPELKSVSLRAPARTDRAAFGGTVLHRPT